MAAATSGISSAPSIAIRMKAALRAVSTELSIPRAKPASASAGCSAASGASSEAVISCTRRAVTARISSAFEP